MIRHIVTRTKLLVPMLLLLAVNCSSDEKAGSEPSTIAKTAEVGQDKVGDGPATPTGDSKKSPSEEIVLIAKPTLSESRFLASISVIKDEVCACKTKECGELAIDATRKLDMPKQVSVSTLKKFETALGQMNVCIVTPGMEPPTKLTLTNSEILAVVTSTKEVVCACKDLECGISGLKTLEPLRETKPTGPSKKKIDALIKEITTCMESLSATATQ